MIGQQSQGYRPWWLPEPGGEVSRIVLYGAGQVYAEISRGWLEHTPFRAGQPASYTHDVLSIAIDPPKRARTVNLGRTEHYFLPDPKANRYRGKHYSLYLYCEPAPQPVGEFLAYDTGTARAYQTYLRLRLPGEVERLGPQEELVLAVSSRTET